MNRSRLVWVILGVVMGLLLVVAGPAAAQGSAERPFAPGGQVRIDLSAGAYTIQAGHDDRILVRWETSTPVEKESVKADIQPRGTDATVTISGPRNHFKAVIEVPGRSDLRVSISAGDLQIEGVTGNKEVESWAGRIDIDVGRPDDYASVRASVTAGELQAAPFNAGKGGLFRSFSWKGPGRYTLDVRLTAGDVRLRASGAR
jgi:hypothetical protein